MADDAEADTDCPDPDCAWCTWWAEVSRCSGAPCSRIDVPGHAAPARAHDLARRGRVVRCEPDEVLVKCMDSGLVSAWSHAPFEPVIALGDSVVIHAQSDSVAHGNGLTNVFLTEPPDDDIDFWLAAAEAAVAPDDAQIALTS